MDTISIHFPAVTLALWGLGIHFPAVTISLLNAEELVYLLIGVVAALIATRVVGHSSEFFIYLIVAILGAFLGKWAIAQAGVPMGTGFVPQVITAQVGAVALMTAIRYLGEAIQKARERPDLGREFLTEYRKAEKQKVDYAERIEQASGDDIFKYLLLIDVNALESYTTQTRLQAEQSFRLSRLGSLFGFGLLVVAAILGVILQMQQRGFTVAYLTGLAGLLTEFVSGVFFYLYNATLKQINRFHSELQWSRRTALGLLLSATVQDASVRDSAKREIAALLMFRDGDTHVRNAERDARTQKPKSHQVAPGNP